MPAKLTASKGFGVITLHHKRVAELRKHGFNTLACLKAAQHIPQVTIFFLHRQVNMSSYDDVTKHYQPFLVSAKVEAVSKNFIINILGKYVNSLFIKTAPGTAQL